MVFQEKENVINKCVLYFSIRMETLTVDNSLFEDSDLSQPLISANPRTANARPTCVFVTIGQDKCFKFSKTVSAEALVINACQTC